MRTPSLFQSDDWVKNFHDLILKQIIRKYRREDGDGRGGRGMDEGVGGVKGCLMCYTICLNPVT